MRLFKHYKVAVLNCLPFSYFLCFLAAVGSCWVQGPRIGSLDFMEKLLKFNRRLSHITHESSELALYSSQLPCILPSLEN